MSLLAAVLVILADDVMSFFGSMGNDSGYNAWTNDMTTDKNRGQIGAALATQPVIGTIVGTVVGGMLIGSDDNYQRLFWVMGVFVIAMGVLSLLVLRDAPSLKPYKDGSFWHQFGKVFNFKSFFGHKELVLVCAATALFFIAFNVYFVQMGNWMIYYMGFSADTMGLIQGLGLIVAMLLAIPAIRFINRKKTPYVAAAAIVINMIGLWMLYGFVNPGTVDTGNIFSASNLPLFFAIFMAGAGYILIMQSMTMWVKQLYPAESRGQFEGIRVMFFTLIPMIIGTSIGNAVIKNGAGTVVNEYGITENIPTETMYLWAALLVLLTFIPLYFAGRRYYQRVKIDNDQVLTGKGDMNHAEGDHIDSDTAR
jgi:MFS family permease